VNLLGTVADAAVELRTGRIRHYLVARSDPRLPGSSRWRLDPERILDQQPGQVITGLQGLDDLPLARASVRQEFLRRSRRWRQQMGEETARWRDQVQQAGGRFEERLEGWLEEPPWEPPEREQDRWPPAEPAAPPWSPSEPPWEPRDGAAASRPVPESDLGGEPWDDGWEASSRPAAPEPLLHPRRSRPATPGPEDQDDPWV